MHIRWVRLAAEMAQVAMLEHLLPAGALVYCMLIRLKQWGNSAAAYPFGVCGVTRCCDGVPSSGPVTLVLAPCPLACLLARGLACLLPFGLLAFWLACLCCWLAGLLARLLARLLACLLAAWLLARTLWVE